MNSEYKILFHLKGSTRSGKNIVLKLFIKDSNEMVLPIAMKSASDFYPNWNLDKCSGD